MAFQAVSPSEYPWYDYSKYSFSLGIAAGEGVYLSGHTASEYDPEAGRIVIRGGMAHQTKTAYAKIGAILEAAGKSYGDVARIVEYVRPEGIDRYSEAAGVRAETFKGHAPVINTVPVGALLRPEALIEIEVTVQDTTPKQAGGVFLATVQPVDDGGRVIGAGDVAAQTQAIFETAGKTLAALGLDFTHVVKTVDYVTPASLAEYKATADVRRAHLGPVYPAATGIIMPRLLHPDALIQCDFIAAREMPQAVNPGWQRYEKLTYSPGVKAGRSLYLSGQGAINPETGALEHGGDVVAQARYTYENILKVLSAAGGSVESMVKTIEYITPAALPRYREVGGLRSEQLAKPYPAATGLICDRLLRDDMQIEVDAFAVLEGS